MEIYHSSGGNLVAGDGYLIVAQSDALVVFCQNSRLIDRYRDELAKNPDRAGTLYRLRGPPKPWVATSFRRSNRTSRRPGGRGQPKRSTAFP